MICQDLLETTAHRPESHIISIHPSIHPSTVFPEAYSICAHFHRHTLVRFLFKQFTIFPSVHLNVPFFHLSCSVHPIYSSLPRFFAFSLSLSLPPSFLPRGHVTALHDYWRNHSCNSLPSFRWGLLYLSLSLPQVLRHCLGNCMCKARDACDPLRQGSRRREGAHHRGGEEKAKKKTERDGKKQQFDVSYYVSQLEP